jgi:SAM-dependent methyltransferase
MKQTKNYQIKPGYVCNEIRSIPGTPRAQQDRHLSSVAQYYVYKAALSLSRGIAARRILDVGCGMGLKLKEFFYDEFEVFGVDAPPGVCEARKEMPKGVFIEEDLQNPRFGLKEHLSKADIIVCADVVEHVEDPDAVLKFIREFAGPKTFILLSTPERDLLHGPSNNQPRNPFHVREWNFSEFSAYLRTSGFEIESHKIILSNQLRFDFETFEWFLGKIVRGKPIRHTQLAICRLPVG